MKYQSKHRANCATSAKMRNWSAGCTKQHTQGKIGYIEHLRYGTVNRSTGKFPGTLKGRAASIRDAHSDIIVCDFL